MTLVRAKPFGLARADVVAAATLTVLLLGCIALAHPVSPTGFDDDWSYAWVAYRLAATGHLHYSGWGSPTVLFQSAWGAFWAHFFGFSFNLLRAATLPFSVGFSLCLYWLGRRTGLQPVWAFFGAAVVVLNPLFLPLAASFMTEPYSCFFGVACLCAAVLALDSKHRPAVMAAIAALCVAGCLGGSSRQTVWTAPLLLLPLIAFRKRGDRWLLAAAVLGFLLCVAALVYCVRHFTQPYAPLRLPASQLAGLVLQRHIWTLALLFTLALTGLLLAWSALLCFLPAWWRLPRRVLAGFAIGALALAVVQWRFFHDGGVIPYIGNVFSPYGVLFIGQDGLGFKPKLLQNRYLFGPSVLFLFSAAVALLAIRRDTRRLPRHVRDVFLLSVLGYLPLLLPGALLGLLFDRYTLALLPQLVIWLLFHAQELHRREPAPRLGQVWQWAPAALLALLSTGYGTAVTHDYYATLRARAQASRQAVSTGVPARSLSAGFEQDGWSQLLANGHLQAVGFGDHVPWNTTSVFWFWSYTKALRHDFVVLTKTGPVPGQTGALVTIPYRTWFAPRQRYAAVWRYQDIPPTHPCVQGAPCQNLDKPLDSLVR